MTEHTAVSQEDMAADLLLFKELHGDDSDLREFNSSITELNALQDNYDQLARIQISLNKSVEKGAPLSPTTMQIVRIVTESMTNDKVIASDPNLYPALELFKDPKISLSASNIAVENLLDKVKIMSKKVLDMILYVWDKLKEFLKKIFDRSKEQKEFLEAVMQEVKELPDNVSANSNVRRISVESEDFLSTRHPFSINGRTDFESAMLITSTTEKLVKSNCDIIDDITRCLNGIGKNVGFQQIQSETERITAQVKKNFTHMTLKSTKHEGGDTIYKYAYLLNQQACVLRERVSKTYGAIDYTVFPIRVMYDKLDDLPDFQNPEIMTKSEMLALGHKAADLGNATEKLRSLQPIIERSLHDKVCFLRNVYEDEFRMATQEELTAIQLIRDLVHYVSTNMSKLVEDGHKTAVSAGYYIKSCVYKYKQGII